MIVILFFSKGLTVNVLQAVVQDRQMRANYLGTFFCTNILVFVIYAE